MVPRSGAGIRAIAWVDHAARLRSNSGTRRSRPQMPRSTAPRVAGSMTTRCARSKGTTRLCHLAPSVGRAHNRIGWQSFHSGLRCASPPVATAAQGHLTGGNARALQDVPGPDGGRGSAATGSGMQCTALGWHLAGTLGALGAGLAGRRARTSPGLERVRRRDVRARRPSPLCVLATRREAAGLGGSRDPRAKAGAIEPWHSKLPSSTWKGAEHGQARRPHRHCHRRQSGDR
jgi:hypothetical protein